MKVFSRVMLIFIFIFLIGISLFEEYVSSNAISVINEDCYLIEENIKDMDNIKSSKIVLMVDNMEYSWMQNESKLCYLVNHKSIQEIGIELAKLKNYLGENDIKEFKASLEAIKYYADSYLHFMGANFHNIL